MTILTAHHSSRIRNRSMGVLHLIAADESCEVSDILALLSQPSPASQAPAARMSDPAPADVQAEELPHGSSATPISCVHLGEQRAELGGDDCVGDGKSEVSTGGGREGAQAPSDASPATFLPVGEATTGKSAGEQSPAAPVKRVTQRQRVKDCHEANPEWGATKIATELDMSKANVWSIASAMGIKFAGKTKATTEALKAAVAKPAHAAKTAPAPSELPRAKQPPAGRTERRSIKQQVADTLREHPGWSAEQIASHIGAKMNTVSHALHDARAEAGMLEAEPVPAPNPQQPVGVAPKATTTLTERVRHLHHQHPNWTATMLAKELGAKPTGVSTILGQVRGKAAAPVEQPQFSGRREMVEHYGAIAKRLGKPS